MPSWIMFFLIVVALPVLLGVGADVFKRWIKHQEKRLELEAQIAAGHAAQDQDYVARLEQRIAVLERIATDPAERTAREIEDLR